MRNLGNMVVIGSGASAIYLLNQIMDHIGDVSSVLESITVLEKTSLTGYGMPYHPETTDIHNMSNISSEEIPKLPETFYDWLRSCDDAHLNKWNIDRAGISESEVYGRLPLGEYLNSQYRTIVSRIVEAGVPVYEKTLCNVTDILPDDSGDHLIIKTCERARMTFDSVVIATGHSWGEDDDPENGYFGSPWPISKILPKEGEFLEVNVGTLGASLSAFDVISSLSHRHGEFRKDGEGLSYHPFPGTEKFSLSMHSAKGWLPHLQFDQEEPFRVIYRHADRHTMLALRDAEGRLRIDDYFEKICRPALTKALEKDGFSDLVTKLEKGGFSLKSFVELMSEQHDYPDAFSGMREEMKEARESVENHKPIHWKEVVDDLMYSLNFHAELMPAEDHLVLKKTVMPFLMNVIAAMPLPSANMLLALHDAGKLHLVPGRVSLEEGAFADGHSTVTVDDEGEKQTICYGIFVDCSGQKSLELDQYPFPGLVKAGRVRRARAEFVTEASYRALELEGDDDYLFREESKFLLHTGGLDIDAAYRVIGNDGTPDNSVFDLSFPHTSGNRPYSYGLQACNATAEVVVGAWVEAIEKHKRIQGGLEDRSEQYVEI